ncbi:MAG: ADP-ribosylglycohydrolase family protein [Pseudomonadota bacterium]
MTDVPLPRFDQFAGSLFGCAVADSLGAPIEGQSREHIATIKDVTSAFRSFREYEAGQITDDTQLTIAAIKGIIRDTGISGDTIADEISQLWIKEEIVGAGPVAKRAVNNYINGVPWDKAAEEGDLALNGAAMRISPVGLWRFDQPGALARDVHTVSIVTHRHPDSIAAAHAIAAAVAWVVQREDIDPKAMCANLANSISAESSLSSLLLELPEWLNLPEDEALKRIAGDYPLFAKKGEFGVPVSAIPTALAAIYAFLRNPHDYLSAIEITLRFGGDVDTIGAIVGAISGAFNGVDAVPRHLREQVKDSEAIATLAEDFYRAFLKSRNES